MSLSEISEGDFSEIFVVSCNAKMKGEKIWQNIATSN